MAATRYPPAELNHPIDHQPTADAQMAVTRLPVHSRRLLTLHGTHADGRLCLDLVVVVDRLDVLLDVTVAVQPVAGGVGVIGQCTVVRHDGPFRVAGTATS